MGFDNTFEVNPPSGVPSGPALGVNTNTGALYVATPKLGTWTQAGGATNSTAVTNLSNVAGATVTAALNTLNGVSSPYVSASVTLTASQIIALGTTPIQVVAGVSGTYLSILQVILEYTAGTTVFTTTSGALLVGVGTAGTLASGYTQNASGFLNQSASQVSDSAGVNIATLAPAATASVSGQGIYITGQTWNVTNGNGTLKVAVIYNSFTL